MAEDPRLGIRLETTGGDYYDQILSMSQGVINASLGNLHEKNVALRVIKIKGDDSEIDAEMNPPRITIPDVEELDQSKIYFHLSFKSGTMKTMSGNFSVDMAGWILIIKADLERSAVSRSEKNDQSDQDKAEREYIDKQLQVPGDYRIERLYVKLFSLSLGQQIDAHNSMVVNPRTKQKCTYQEWKDEVRKYNQTSRIKDRSVQRFGDVLEDWAEAVEYNGLTTVGIKISKPPSDKTPTFVPRSLIHEMYPYRDGTEGSDNDVTKGRDQNCLLYMETVGDHEGPKKMLEWSANLAYPAHDGLTEVTGTFALRRQLFLEQFLLPQLQEINKVTTIVIEPAILSGGYRFPSTWSGGVKDDTDASDPKFMFKLKADEKTYEYAQAADKPTPPIWKGPGYHRMAHSTSSKVAISWVVGTNEIAIDGMIYYVREYYCSSTNSQPDSTNSYAWTLEHYKWPWSFRITATESDGTLELRFPEQGVSGKSEVVFDGSKDFLNRAVDLKNNGLDKTFRPLLEAKITNLNKELNSKFHAAGKFIYPGSGQLNFSQPKFATNGSLFCNAEWKPPVDGSLIRVPN